MADKRHLTDPIPSATNKPHVFDKAQPSKAPLKPQAISFFSLALELREMIYEAALLSKRSWTSAGLELVGHKVANPTLLLISKQFGAEYQKVADKQTTLTVNHTPYYQIGRPIIVPAVLWSARTVEIDIFLPCNKDLEHLLRAFIGKMPVRKIKAIVKNADDWVLRGWKEIWSWLMPVLQQAKDVEFEMYERNRKYSQWFFQGRHFLKKRWDREQGVLVEVESNLL